MLDDMLNTLLNDEKKHIRMDIVLHDKDNPYAEKTDELVSRLKQLNDEAKKNDEIIVTSNKNRIGIDAANVPSFIVKNIVKQLSEKTREFIHNVRIQNENSITGAWLYINGELIMAIMTNNENMLFQISYPHNEKIEPKLEKERTLVNRAIQKYKMTNDINTLIQTIQKSGIQSKTKTIHVPKIIVRISNSEHADVSEKELTSQLISQLEGTFNRKEKRLVLTQEENEIIIDFEHMTFDCFDLFHNEAMPIIHNFRTDIASLLIRQIGDNGVRNFYVSVNDIEQIIEFNEDYTENSPFVDHMTNAILRIDSEKNLSAYDCAKLIAETRRNDVQAAIELCIEQRTMHTKLRTVDMNDFEIDSTIHSLNDELNDITNTHDKLKEIETYWAK